MSHWLSSIFLLSAFSYLLSDSYAFNLTIDDTNSTFFTWTQSYNEVTPSSPCPTCFWQLDASQMYNQTWHDGAEDRSGSCTFRGSDVYIYGADVPGGANISFTMNIPAIQTSHYYGGSQVAYHALLFHASDLDPNTEHSLTWLLAPNSVDGGSVGIFDYAIVTQPDSTQATSFPASTSTGSRTPSTSAFNNPKEPVALIAGAVIGAVGIFALLVGIGFVLWRRRRSAMGHVADMNRDMDIHNPLLVVDPFRESPSPARYPFDKSGSSSAQPSVAPVSSVAVASNNGADPDLEARIRYLEAHMAAQAPPPY
ncbi:hypothetical protein B0H11DRAFT_115077 [Mycena galericulata]|nr:hypothetical protein B0H11DRAFT_115077 [Mycena galericulata]